MLLAGALLAVSISLGALASPVPIAGAIGGFACALSFAGAYRDRIALLGGALLVSAAVTMKSPFQFWPTADSAPLHGLALLAIARARGFHISAGVTIVLSTLAFAPLNEYLVGRLFAAAAIDTVAIFALPFMQGALGGLTRSAAREAGPSPVIESTRTLMSVLWVVSMGVLVASQLRDTAVLPSLASAFTVGTVAILAANALNRSPAPYAVSLADQLGVSISESEYSDLYSNVMFWVRPQERASTWLRPSIMSHTPTLPRTALVRFSFRLRHSASRLRPPPPFQSS